MILGTYNVAANVINSKSNTFRECCQFQIIGPVLRFNRYKTFELFCETETRFGSRNFQEFCQFQIIEPILRFNRYKTFELFCETETRFGSRNFWEFHQFWRMGKVLGISQSPTRFRITEVIFIPSPLPFKLTCGNSVNCIVSCELQRFFESAPLISVLQFPGKWVNFGNIDCRLISKLLQGLCDFMEFLRA